MNRTDAKKMGQKGGKVRAERLTATERSNEARTAVTTRWERQRERDRLTAEVIAAAKAVYRYSSVPSVTTELLGAALDALDAL